MEKGYVHVYTGDGKGKTTAALGLALRAACAGMKVYFGQFVKGMDYSELKAEGFVPGLEFHQFGRDCFIHKEPASEDIAAAVSGLAACAEAMSSGKYDIVVLDELNIALYYGLFSASDAVNAVSARSAGTEVIITGRKAPDEILDIADLITEMKEISHYYTKGVQAREGIEK